MTLQFLCFGVYFLSKTHERIIASSGQAPGSGNTILMTTGPMCGNPRLWYDHGSIISLRSYTRRNYNCFLRVLFVRAGFSFSSLIRLLPLLTQTAVRTTARTLPLKHLWHYNCVVNFHWEDSDAHFCRLKWGCFIFIHRFFISYVGNNFEVVRA